MIVIKMTEDNNTEEMIIMTNNKDMTNKETIEGMIEIIDEER